MLDFLFGSKGGSRRLDVATVSRRGLVRRDNQDHFVADRVRSFFAVADGMGGGQGGSEASEIVCANLAKAVDGKVEFSDRLRDAAKAIDASNDEIRDFARKAGYDQMATTLTLLAMDEAPSTTAVVANVGDSRIYRFRNGVAQRLTRDHTVIGELDRQPGAKAMKRELGSGINYLKHVLTRAVGIEPEVVPDWKKIEMRAGDAFLLCSDGVYGMVSDGELAKSFALASAADIVADIEKKILAAGADDNYTAVVVRVGGAQ